MSTPSSAPAPIDGRQRRAALLVAGCLFMELLDGTIVTTSAPQIGRSLAVAPTAIGLLITAYFVTVAALMPVSGWAASRWGARRVFLAAVALFAVASLGCALSTSLPELVAMRVLQGAGGAMMMPVGRLVVLARTAKADLMRITAYIVWPALLAPVVAPLAGGAITTYANWHWLFLVNLPLAAVALLAGARLIDGAPAAARPPLDGAGIVLACGALAAAAGTAGILSERSPDWIAAIAVGVAAAILATAAVRHLLRCANPVVDLRAVRIATFATSLSGLAVFGMVVGATPFLMSLLFQEIFAWSAVKSGAVVLFVFLGNIAIKPATTFLFGRFGFRAMLAVAASTVAALMVAAAFFTASTPIVLIGIVLFAGGIARSIGGTGYSTIAFSEVPPEQMRDANTLQAIVQQLSAGFGVAAGTIALRAGAPLSRWVLADARASSAYAVAFVLLAILALVPLRGALALHPAAGDVLRGERARGEPAAGPAEA